MSAKIIFLTYKLTIWKKNVQVRTQVFNKIPSVLVKQIIFFPIYRSGILLLLVAFVVADSNLGSCPSYNNTGATITPAEVIYFAKLII